VSTPLPQLITSENATVERRRNYARFRAIYEGTPPHALRRAKNRRRSVRNWGALVVDTVTSYMGDPSIQLGDTGEQNAAEAYLAEIYRRERLPARDYETEVACAVDGDAVWKVTWDDRERRVRVSAVDPARVYALTRPDDLEEVELFAEQYTMRAEDGPILFNQHLRSLNTTRATVTITEEWTPTAWRIWVNNDLEQDAPNPYGVIPYVHACNYRNPYRLWGASDIGRVEGILETIDQAEWDNDDTMALAGLLVILTNVDEQADLAVAPGAIWSLPEAAQASTLDVLRGNLGGQRLAYLDHLTATLQQLSRTPSTALGGSGGPNTNVSGLALQVQLGPILRLVARKRRTRSVAYEARAALMLRLAAMFGGLPESSAQLTPSVHWSETVPTDRRDALEAAEIEARLGRDLVEVLRSIGVENPAEELAARLRQRSHGLDPSAQREETPDGRPDPKPARP
jgi:hypothetical protein